MCMDLLDVEAVLNETKLCVDILEHIAGEIFEYANPVGESAHTKEENAMAYYNGRHTLIMYSNMLVDYILSLKDNILVLEKELNL